jgi:hypothetical protein
MGIFQRIWSAIAGSELLPPSMSNSSPMIASKNESTSFEIELVPTETSDPYQVHTHLPHCSDHFLFTKDCALCQEIMQAHPQKLHPVSRSFGFTDNVATASLTPTLGNLGPTPANAALQSASAIILQAEVPYRTVSETLAVNTLVDTVVDAVDRIEIDSIKSD